MATYKKRGYKGSKENTEHTENVNSTTAEVFESLDKQASKSEAWVAKNQKFILAGIGVVVFGVLAFLAYQQFVLKPKETEASNEMFYAQQYFDQAVEATGSVKDSLFMLALEGNQGKYGFLDIIKEYSGTKAANLANYSAGMAYLNMNKYQEAVTHLEDFTSDDLILGALAKGGVADAFMQLNQPKDALMYYEKAINHSTNNFTTPRFLFKAGTTAMDLGDNKKALTFFKRIKDEFSNTEEGRTIDMFIGRVENLN